MIEKERAHQWHYMNTHSWHARIFPASKLKRLWSSSNLFLKENGGKVGKVENWGLRTSAYRIQKNRKAHYLHMNVDAPAAAIAEMERQMRINEDILRYMTIKVEEHEEGPSAMMKKADRDDRPRRDDRGPREDRNSGKEADSSAETEE